MSGTRFHSFAEFYPYYLGEHRHPVNRRLHFFGSVVVLALAATFLVTWWWWALVAIPVAGYGLSWLGHFAFERNRPATFGQPLYSLLADWVMAKDMLTGRVPF